MRKWWWSLVVLLWCPAMRVQASIVGLNPASATPFAVVLPPPQVVVPAGGTVRLPFVIRQWYGDTLSPVPKMTVTAMQAGRIVEPPEFGEDGVTLTFPIGAELPYQLTMSAGDLTATTIITAAPQTASPQLTTLPAAVSQPFALGIYQLDAHWPAVVWSAPAVTVNYLMALTPGPQPNNVQWTVDDQVVTVNRLPAVTAQPGEWVTLTPNPHLPVVAGGTVTATATIDGQPVVGEPAPNDGVRVQAPNELGKHAYRLELTYVKNNAKKTFDSGGGALTVLPAAPLAQPLPTIPAMTTQGLTVALPPTWWQGLATTTMTVDLSPLTGPGGTLPTVLMGDGQPWLRVGVTKATTAAELASVASWTVVVPPVNTLVAGIYNGTVTVTAVFGP